MAGDAELVDALEAVIGGGDDLFFAQEDDEMLEADGLDVLNRDPRSASWSEKINSKLSSHQTRE